jgi:importin subunit alpha-6/7
MSYHLDARRATFKATVSAEQAQQGRARDLNAIRKQKKEDAARQKRQVVAGAGTPAASAAAAPPAPLAPVDPAQLSAELRAVLAALVSPDPSTQLQGTMECRKILSRPDKPPIDEVVRSGAVGVLTAFLRRDDAPLLQLNAAWALTNVASGTTQHTQAVVQAGAVPLFVGLLASRDCAVREQACWALGNIAGDTPLLRDAVLANGAMGAMLQYFGQGDMTTSMVRNGAWTVSNFCRGKPCLNVALVRQVVPLLAALVFHDDAEVVADACWAFSYVSDGSDQHVDAVLQAGVTARLVSLLGHPSVSVQVPALRTVGNLVTGDDVQTQVVLNQGVLEALAALLQSPRQSLRKEAAWMVSNITAGTKHQVAAVLAADRVVPMLVRLVTVGEVGVRREAVWALSNACCHGSPDQVAALVAVGVVPSLCQALNSLDGAMAPVVLDAVEAILTSWDERVRGGPGDLNEYAQIMEENGVVTALERMLLGSKACSDKAQALLDTYFAEDFEEEDGTATAAAAAAFLSEDASAFVFGSLPAEARANPFFPVAV